MNKRKERNFDLQLKVRSIELLLNFLNFIHLWFLVFGFEFVVKIVSFVIFWTYFKEKNVILFHLLPIFKYCFYKNAEKCRFKLEFEFLLEFLNV